jgi:hypothetical protein
MKKNIIAITTLLVLFCGLKAFAETTLTAEVNKLKFTTDETVTYKLSINSTEKNIPRPQIPKFEGFAVISQAQSSTVSWAPSGLKSSLIYSYRLMPKSTGKFKIGPAKMLINGKTYASQEFEVEVTQGKIKSQPKPEEHPSLPEDMQGDTEEPQVTL